MRMLKKIAIIGPESTGKTTLAEKLAKHYRTMWVPEYAREYLDSINRPYTYDDLLLIARGQMQEEDRKAAQANRLLICDTNLVVIKVWSEYKYGKCHPWIDQEMKARQYDLVLLSNFDFPWVADPLREHPENRKELFAIYQNLLNELGVKHLVISGNSSQRFEQAVEAVDALSR